MNKSRLLDSIKHGRKEPELKSLFETIIEFLQDIGMGFLLEEDNPMKVANRVHKRICLQNAYFPLDIDIAIIYPRFFSQVVYGQIEIKGKNISALVQAFNKWIVTVEDRYRAEQGIEVLPQEDPYRNDSISPFMENWPDEMIRRQCAIMKKMGMSFNTGKEGSYFRRIKAELDKRGLTIPDIDLGKPGPLAKHL